MRTILTVSLLALSLALTSVSLLIVRQVLQGQISKGLEADLQRSVLTFRNLAHQRNEMLSHESSLLADLPSLKALLTTADLKTIRDGGREFWEVSGSDLFALTNPQGSLFATWSQPEPSTASAIQQGIESCVQGQSNPCLVASTQSLYEISTQPLYFGAPSAGTRLGYVVVGHAVDAQLARQISEATAAEVAFLVDGKVAATTLSTDRQGELNRQSAQILAGNAATRTLHLGKEAYVATVTPLGAAQSRTVHLLVLKSYDQASEFLVIINRAITLLGLAALLFGGLLAAAISRTVTSPLEALVKATRALGRGDFNHRVTASGAVELRELATAFDRMRGELSRTQARLIDSERLATIGRMASSVSHDLRHHLSAIYANAEFLSLTRTRDAERVELMREVHDAVQAMTDLIESLLLFSQTGQALHRSSQSTAALLESVAQSLRRHPECRDVELEVHQGSPGMAWVDSRKLGRAIFNMLLNACQAARTGQIPAHVTASVHETETAVEIRIEDTGSGVPEEIRQTLFSPFVSAGKANGVGLGLTLAQHIAQEHGGEVQMRHSAPGSTVFCILLFKSAWAGIPQQESPHSTQATDQPDHESPTSQQSSKVESGFEAT